MNQQSYDAAQQGLLSCLLDYDHESRLTTFLNGLRGDSQWTDAQVDEVAVSIRETLKRMSDWPLLRSDNATLSQREEQTLKFVVQGLTLREIALRFSLSPKTTETYKQRAMTKLGLQSRADVVRYGIEQGWLSSSQEST